MGMGMGMGMVGHTIVIISLILINKLRQSYR